MRSNPFATRFIRPGAIPFLFLDGDSADAIVQRLKSNGWRGQIIGEHGSGKSTLLATLVPLMESAERQVTFCKLGPGQRKLPIIDTASFTAATQLIIDGYEQLSWFSRLTIRWRIWKKGAGLLVTAHTGVGLPMLYQTNPSQAVAVAVAEKLTESQRSTVSLNEVLEAYREANGDIRETLFKLFDVCQQRAKSKTSE